MNRIITRCAALLLAVGLLAGVARAALPDPVAFELAVEQGHIEQVRRWLDEGLDPDYMGVQLGTGLMIAAWNGNIPMMELFVARGAKLERSNQNDEQALQLAAWNGHAEAVKWLLAHGAPLEREGNRWGALHYAVFKGDNALARYLLERGARVNARAPNGATPLMMAAREGREEAARFLLEAGADSRLTTDWGDSALTFAMRYDHFRLGQMISSPEEFNIAVRKPKEEFGTPSRSTPPPSEVETLLQAIREAEAAGQPSAELHARLRQVINDIRSRALAERKARKGGMPLPLVPRGIVITAKRGQPGAESVRILTDGAPPRALPPPAIVPLKQPAMRPAAKAAPVDADRRAIMARIAELRRQIRQAEAQGRPTDDLQRQLYEAIEAQK